MPSYKWSYCARCDKFDKPKKTECPSCGKPSEPVEAKWGPARIVGQVFFLLAMLTFFGLFIGGVISGAICLFFVAIGPIFVGLILFIVLMVIDQNIQKKKITNERAGRRGPPPPPPPPQ